MSRIHIVLRAIGSPVCTVPDCAPALGISYATIHQRLKNHPELTKPDTYRAGGQQMWSVDEAIAWCEKHQVEWDAIQAARGRG